MLLQCLIEVCKVGVFFVETHFETNTLAEGLEVLPLGCGNSNPATTNAIELVSNRIPKASVHA